jgi:hypothetical protein
VQLVVGGGQGEDRGVELPVAQLGEQHVGLLLHEQQLETGEAPVHGRHDVREEVGGERGEQPEPDGAGLGVARPVGRARRMSATSASTPRARSTTSPPAWVSSTCRGLRSMSSTPSSCSSLRICVDRVGWLTNARLGGAPEVTVLGQGDEVAAGRAGSSTRRSGSGRGAAPPSHQAGTGSGTVVRIRWSKALRAAVEPAPRAITICL